MRYCVKLSISWSISFMPKSLFVCRYVDHRGCEKKDMNMSWTLEWVESYLSFFMISKKGNKNCEKGIRSYRVVISDNRHIDSCWYICNFFFRPKATFIWLSFLGFFLEWITHDIWNILVKIGFWVPAMSRKMGDFVYPPSAETWV